MGYNMAKNVNYEKGCVRAEWKNGLDAYKIDYSDLHGFNLYAFLQSPSEDDVQKMSENADLVVYFEELDGVAFFTFNFSGEGGSCAFCPSLLLDYPHYKISPDLNSYPVTLHVIDSTKGELLDKRRFTFSESFSKYLHDWMVKADSLNLSIDEVMDVSKKYFESLSNEREKHSFQVAYDNKRLLERSKDLSER